MSNAVVPLYFPSGVVLKILGLKVLSAIIVKIVKIVKQIGQNGARPSAAPRGGRHFKQVPQISMNLYSFWLTKNLRPTILSTKWLVESQSRKNNKCHKTGHRGRFSSSDRSFPTSLTPRNIFQADFLVENGIFDNLFGGNCQS